MQEIQTFIPLSIFLTYVEKANKARYRFLWSQWGPQGCRVLRSDNMYSCHVNGMLALIRGPSPEGGSVRHPTEFSLYNFGQMGVKKHLANAALDQAKVHPYFELSENIEWPCGSSISPSDHSDLTAFLPTRGMTISLLPGSDLHDHGRLFDVLLGDDCFILLYDVSLRSGHCELYFIQVASTGWQ